MYYKKNITLKYHKTTNIDSNWCEYDKKTAICHLHNYGCIYCDHEYKTPIDNEFDLEIILIMEGKR